MKRTAGDEAERAHKKLNGAAKGANGKHFLVHKHLLSGLGGGWANTPPFSGDEDRLYRWVTEPALWARIIMDNLAPKLQQRLVQLHAALHDSIDASGFVCWRTLPPLKPGVTVTLCSKGLRPVSAQLPAVSLKQHRLTSSSHFGACWVARSHVGC